MSLSLMRRPGIRRSRCTARDVVANRSVWADWGPDIDVWRWNRREASWLMAWG